MVRRSKASQADAEAAEAKAEAAELNDEAKEGLDDHFLPIANIQRIMKRAMPDGAKVAKEAKETVQECVSEFISFITSEASNKCAIDKRKTLSGEDLMWAIKSLGFDEYYDPLNSYLEGYRRVEANQPANVAGGGAGIKRRGRKRNSGGSDGSAGEGEAEDAASPPTQVPLLHQEVPGYQHPQLPPMMRANLYPNQRPSYPGALPQHQRQQPNGRLL